jgi:hypothetical protein
MPYLLVALIVTAIVVLLAWRGLSSSDEGRTDGPRPPVLRNKNRLPRTVAPDDDPDFLGEIDRKLRGEDKSN